MRKRLALVTAAAGIAAAGGAQAAAGDIVTTQVGCKTAAAYDTFEKVYKKDGRMAAYKAMLDTGKCARLPKEIDVKLLKAVADFDYGWGTGKVWEVKPVPDTKMTPKTFYIRIRTEK